jgi:hypothetical protein
LCRVAYLSPFRALEATTKASPRRGWKGKSSPPRQNMLSAGAGIKDQAVLRRYARKDWFRRDGNGQPKTGLRQVGMCPSGRLIAIDKETGNPVEPELPQSIGVVEDTAEKCSGPLWVRGGISLVGSDGQAYEVRNRVTLCRCGRSDNKPFCNGSHSADPKFRDGLR